MRIDSPRLHHVGVIAPLPTKKRLPKKPTPRLSPRWLVDRPLAPRSRGPKTADKNHPRRSHSMPGRNAADDADTCYDRCRKKGEIASVVGECISVSGVSCARLLRTSPRLRRVSSVHFSPRWFDRRILSLHVRLRRRAIANETRRYEGEKTTAGLHGERQGASCSQRTGRVTISLTILQYPIR